MKKILLIIMLILSNFLFACKEKNEVLEELKDYQYEFHNDAKFYMLRYKNESNYTITSYLYLNDNFMATIVNSKVYAACLNATTIYSYSTSGSKDFIRTDLNQSKTSKMLIINDFIKNLEEITKLKFYKMDYMLNDIYNEVFSYKFSKKIDYIKIPYKSSDDDIQDSKYYKAIISSSNLGKLPTLFNIIQDYEELSNYQISSNIEIILYTRLPEEIKIITENVVLYSNEVENTDNIDIIIRMNNMI